MAENYAQKIDTTIMSADTISILYLSTLHEYLEAFKTKTFSDEGDKKRQYNSLTKLYKTSEIYTTISSLTNHEESKLRKVFLALEVAGLIETKSINEAFSVSFIDGRLSTKTLTTAGRAAATKHLHKTSLINSKELCEKLLRYAESKRSHRIETVLPPLWPDHIIEFNDFTGNRIIPKKTMDQLSETGNLEDAKEPAVLTQEDLNLLELQKLELTASQKKAERTARNTTAVGVGSVAFFIALALVSRIEAAALSDKLDTSIRKNRTLSQSVEVLSMSDEAPSLPPSQTVPDLDNAIAFDLNSPFCQEGAFKKFRDEKILTSDILPISDNEDWAYESEHGPIAIATTVSFSPKHCLSPKTREPVTDCEASVLIGNNPRPVQFDPQTAHVFDFCGELVRVYAEAVGNHDAISKLRNGEPGYRDMSIIRLELSAWPR